MPFFGDMIQEVYKEYTKPTVENVGMKCIRGDDIFSVTSVMEDIFEAICEAHIVIGEFTGRNPNVLYEAGIAHTLGKPLICITQNIEDVPFDMRSIRHIVYKTTPSGLRELTTALKNTILSLLNESLEMFPREHVDNDNETKALWEMLIRERRKSTDMYLAIENRILQGYEQYHKKIHSISQHSVNLVAFRDIGVDFIKINNSIVDVDYYDDESEEVVNIDREQVHDFYISKTPITNKQYQIFTEATGHPSPEYWENSIIPQGHESHPVIGVSWVDIVMFCKWMTETSGVKVDIPTEAQWLVASGYAMNKQLYPWGTSWEDNACNSKEYDRGKRRITSVFRFEKNISPYGCLDMLGNVWEWTKSPYDYRDSNGFEWRAVRGGANYTELKNMGNLARLVAHPGHFLFVRDLGFRVVTVGEG